LSKEKAKRMEQGRQKYYYWGKRSIAGLGKTLPTYTLETANVKKSLKNCEGMNSVILEISLADQKPPTRDAQASKVVA